MIDILWDLDDDPRGNVRHIPIDELLSKDDVEHAVNHPIADQPNRRNRRRLVGLTEDGLLLVVIYESAGENLIYPITAFFVEE